MDQILSKFHNFGVVGKLRSRSFQIDDQILVNDAKFPNFAKIQISKFTKIANFIKFQIFQFHQNLTKNQNSATVVYCNFLIKPKFQSQNFPKFVPIWANNRHKLFWNFWSRYQNPQNSSKLAQITKILKKILKTPTESPFWLFFSRSWSTSLTPELGAIMLFGPEEMRRLPPRVPKSSAAASAFSKTYKWGNCARCQAPRT